MIPLTLPDDLLTDIYSENAIRLFRGVPRPMDHNMAYAACKYIAEQRWDELNEIGKKT